MNNFEIGKIHETANISTRARIGKDVTIGGHVMIYDHVRIGDNSIIGPYSILGEPTQDYYQSPNDYIPSWLVIGSNSLIRSHSVIYSGTTIGDHFSSGHRVTIREGSVIGNHCSIGTLSDVQGKCKIGNYSRLHSNVFVGEKSEIGEFVWIFPYCVLTNDPHPPSNDLMGVKINDFSVVATKVTILPGVEIGKHALVGAHSLVTRDVLPESVVVGVPAREVGKIHDIKSRFSQESVYPWPYNFERGMPWQGIGFETWKKEMETD